MLPFKFKFLKNKIDIDTDKYRNICYICKKNKVWITGNDKHEK